MNHSSSIALNPYALFYAAIRSLGFYKCITGIQVLLLEFSPAIGERAHIFHDKQLPELSVDSFLRSVLLLEIFPGILLLIGGASITSWIAGKSFKQNQILIQGMALFYIGLSLIGLWKIMVGISGFILPYTFGIAILFFSKTSHDSISTENLFSAVNLLLGFLIFYISINRVRKLSFKKTA